MKITEKNLPLEEFKGNCKVLGWNHNGDLVRFDMREFIRHLRNVTQMLLENELKLTFSKIDEKENK